MLYTKTMKRRLPINRQNVLLLAAGAILAIGGVFIVQEVQNMPQPLRYQDKGVTIQWLPQSVKRWSKDMDTMGKKYNVDPNLLAIIMTIESGGNPKANSGVATGLMQITKPTSRDIASKYLQKPVSRYNLEDGPTSIEFGAAYLAMLRKEYTQGNSDLETMYTAELVAAAYNGGFGAANAIEAGEGINDTQTIVYSRDVFNMWRERHAAGSPTFNRWLERGASRLLILPNNL